MRIRPLSGDKINTAVSFGHTNLKRLQERVLLLENNAVAAEKRFAKYEGFDTQKLLGQAQRDIKSNSDDLKKMMADMTEFAKPLSLQTYVAPVVDRALEEKWKIASSKFDADLDTLHKHSNELLKHFEEKVDTIKKSADTVMDKVTVLNGDFDEQKAWNSLVKSYLGNLEQERPREGKTILEAFKILEDELTAFKLQTANVFQAQSDRPQSYRP